MSYYVIPDIHGRNDLLQKALKDIYRREPNGGKIIFLGDYIDRGPDNKGVLETVMNPPKDWEFVCLKGNHEDMFLAAYMDHMRNGTRASHDFYDPKVLYEFVPKGEPLMVSFAVNHIPTEIIEWMSELKPFHFEGKNIFAHAFYDLSIPPELQRDVVLYWYRMPDSEAFPNVDGEYLTHGHTPRANGPVRSPNRINLDAGAVFYGNLAYAKYEVDKTGPVALYMVR